MEFTVVPEQYPSIKLEGASLEAALCSHFRDVCLNAFHAAEAAVAAREVQFFIRFRDIAQAACDKCLAYARDIHDIIPLARAMEEVSVCQKAVRDIVKMGDLPRDHWNKCHD